MKSRLKDDDPALPPEVLKARLKQRAKLARRLERAVTGEAPLVGGCPTKADVKPNTLQRRKRKAEREATLSLTDVGLPDFSIGVEATTTGFDDMAEAQRVAEILLQQWLDELLAKVGQKAAKEERVAHNLAPTAHGVAFETQLSVAAAVDDTVCAICLEPASTTVSCCGKVMHKACLGTWLQCSGERWPLNYGENAKYIGVIEDSVSMSLDEGLWQHGHLAIDTKPDGRQTVTDEPVNTKNCPCCQTATSIYPACRPWPLSCDVSLRMHGP